MEEVEGTGEEMKKLPLPKPNKDHEQAKQMLALEALAVSKHTGLSVNFCAKIALNRVMRRAQEVTR